MNPAYPRRGVSRADPLFGKSCDTFWIDWPGRLQMAQACRKTRFFLRIALASTWEMRLGWGSVGRPCRATPERHAVRIRKQD